MYYNIVKILKELVITDFVVFGIFIPDNFHRKHVFIVFEEVLQPTKQLV